MSASVRARNDCGRRCGRLCDDISQRWSKFVARSADRAQECRANAQSDPRAACCWLLSIVAWLALSIVAIVTCARSYQAPYQAQSMVQTSTLSTPSGHFVVCHSVNLTRPPEVVRLQVT